jgi:nitroimidazol reductase NimA-like FMN-containing flavoprotein (pyridoxamine 5'-phosphate oxidase superfamily)
MKAIDLLGGTEIVSEHDCWEMLATQSIGRLALVHEGQIEVFPVNYGLDGSAIVFQTNGGRKIIGIASGEVTFEVDSVDQAGRFGWSVVVRGAARVVTGSDAPRGGPAVNTWTGAKDFLVRIDPRSISGRRVAPFST